MNELQKKLEISEVRGLILNGQIKDLACEIKPDKLNTEEQVFKYFDHVMSFGRNDNEKIYLAFGLGYMSKE